MATKYSNADADSDNDDTPVQNIGCVHAISAECEKQLAANPNPDNEVSKNANEISNCKIEEDITDNLIIDIVDQKEFFSTPTEICDSATLHAHTLRLNPNYYAAMTSTPNTGHTQVHQPNAKKTSLITNDESKLSPRKHSPKTSTTTNITNTAREKRKSPTKKCKSPIRTQTETRPFVILPSTSSAIACAKKLKDLVNSGDGTEHNNDEHEDLECQQHYDILVNTQSKINTGISADSVDYAQIIPKTEVFSDMEFLSESSTCSYSSPCKQTETNKHETESCNSDKDSNLDVVATLATGSDKGKILTEKETTDKKTTNSASWTRDEDKIILVEMSSLQKDDLYKRISEKLTNRTIQEIQERHSFLINFLTQLQAI
ncbi:uncharacterized protein LOC119678679 [Teleopsis dalmanni]|uniref:uncharacterized protein LOC119678679 n=1 Tax=Teleopsis dalmanni TaxID=139649 RepID=UPI0018CDF82F|nr:uncharacterized protein LOC119678679 [Teleopsis dalmanni]